MKLPEPVFGNPSQKSLHERPFKWRDLESRSVSVFPLFDDEGKTQVLMITDSGDSQILLPEHTKDLFRARGFLLRRRELSLRRADLSDSSQEDVARVADLWHFDPWWELKDPRYTNHPVVPAIKGTNLPGFDDRITGAWFDPTLSQVRYLAFGWGDNRKMKRFRPRLLAEAQHNRNALRSKPNFDDEDAASWRESGWRLRPFWERFLAKG